MNRRNLFVLLFYTLVAIVMTYPLAAQFGDHVPGTSIWSMDEYGYVWNNWWFKHALFDRAANPFYTQFLFYPLGTSLVLYAYTLLHVVLALPLQFAFGIIPAVNTTVLFSFVLAAFGMYLFAFYLLRVSLRIWSDRFGERLGEWAQDRRLLSSAAFVAGIAFGFTSSRFVYVSLGHYNIVASEWLPFYLLFLFKALIEPGWKNALLAGLFAALALYTETTDGVLIALLTGVILVFEWRLLSRPVLARLGAIVATAALLFAPLLIPTLYEIFASGYSLPGWGHSEKLLVDLNGFFSPTSLSPFNRNWEAELDRVRQGTARFSDINTFFVGYATALFALMGFARFIKRNRLWLAIVLIFAILALGPLLHINGQSEFDLDGLASTVPLPFLILHYIPLIKENRVPNRYSILVTIGLAVLISYAIWYVLNLVQSALRNRNASHGLMQFSGYAIAGAASAVLLFEHLAVPLPLTDATVPDVYHRIGLESGDFTVLSLPLGWRDSFGQTGAEDTRTQYYQAVSGKFLLTGQIQRNPPSTFKYFEKAPIISSLIALETYQPLKDETIQSDRSLAERFVQFFDIRYVVVNASVPGRPPFSDTRAAALDYVRKVLPLGDKIYDQGGTVAFKVTQTPLTAEYHIQLDGSDAPYSVGEGWTDHETIGGSSAAWATQQDARVFIPLREVRDAVVTVRALPFDYAGHIQTLTLSVNGQSTTSLQMKPDWSEYAFPVPASSLHLGVNQLTWHFGYRVRPSDVITPNYAIGQTGVDSPVDIAVQSTKEFGSIKLNGKEVSPLKRGYDLAIIDPQSGGLLDVRSFDTGGENIEESRSLTEFIKKLRPGVIVAGVVQEEGATMLREGSAAALKSLGLAADLRGTEGRTHAFIAVKGKSGALEASGDGPSLLSVGHNLDMRPLAAAFDWVEFRPGTAQ